MIIRKKVRSVSLLAVLAFACPGFLWAGQVQDGQKLFEAKCVRCHAKDGSGKTTIGSALGAADLRTPAVQKLTDTQIYAQIENGKANMPPFGPGLNKTQINDLIAYVRSLGKKQTVAKNGKKKSR